MEIVIRKGGKLELPKFIRTKSELTTGKKLTVNIMDSIKLDDRKLIEQIVETEDWL